MLHKAERNVRFAQQQPLERSKLFRNSCHVGGCRIDEPNSHHAMDVELHNLLIHLAASSRITFHVVGASFLEHSEKRSRIPGAGVQGSLALPSCGRGAFICRVEPKRIFTDKLLDFFVERFGNRKGVVVEHRAQYLDVCGY